MNSEDIAARKMRMEFMLGTDEGLMAFLYGFMDQILGFEVLKPQEGDTQEVLALKKKGNIYLDHAMKMLNRLSGLDEIGRQILAGEPMWASQNALSAALTGAMVDGIEVASYAGTRYVEPSDDDNEELTAEIVAVLEANPILMKKAMELEDLHGEDDDEEGDR